MAHRGFACVIGAVVAAGGLLAAPAQRAEASQTRFTFTPCAAVALTSDRPSPQQSGTIVTFTATATACAQPQYQFLVQPAGGSWTIAQAYGGPAFTWNTATLAAGTYGIDVWARDQGSGAAHEAVDVVYYTLSPAVACARPGFVSDKQSPQQIGTLITFTGFVDTFPFEGVPNCSQPQFRWWLEPPGGAWVMARDYGEPDFTWNTAGRAGGTWGIGIWVRQNGSTAPYESLILGTYSLVPAVTCAAATLTADRTSPQAPGTVITFSAGSSACSQPLYQFWLQYESGPWHVARAFSAVPSWAWNTSGLLPGAYRIVVWANQNGGPTATYQAYAVLDFVLSRCTAVSATPSPPSPQVTGTTVQLTAAATGCASPVYEFWILFPGSQTWRLAQAYSNSPTFSWNTASVGAGTFNFSVWAREAGSGGAAGNVLGRWDSYVSLAYTITPGPACGTVSATAVPPAPQPPGTAVVITASATGCPNPQYEFWYRGDRDATWRLVQAYSATASYTWDTTGVLRTGLGGTTSHFSIWAKDASSPGLASNVLGRWDAYAMFDYWLNGYPNACNDVSISFAPPTSAPVGSGVTISASSISCANPLYQFWILAPGSQTWQLVQSYSAKATFSWNTAGAGKGQYSVIVMTRDATSAGIGGGNPIATWDAYSFVYYVLS